jgi:N-ethylmaleimide reductase
MEMNKNKKNEMEIFQPMQFGPFKIPNRIAMSALTRMRADPVTCVPNEMHIQYYSERSSDCAFVLTECTGISREGNCFKGGCGIWSDEQELGWSKVVKAVHEKGGRIFLQIWHCGRAGRKYIIGCQPVAPSPIPIRSLGRDSKIITSETPRELSEIDILRIVEDFRKGAVRAKRAGFDGVQLHGANGYLIDQFIRSATNLRKDKFGGSVENRMKFPLMVIDALISVFGSERVGIKLSPVGRYNDMFDEDPLTIYKYFLTQLDERKILFAEIVSPPEFTPCPNFYGVEGEDQIKDVYSAFRPYFKGFLIGNNQINLEKADSLIKSKKIDLVTFGRLFIANPDLVERLKNSWPMNKILEKLFYTSGKEGYIDYPRYRKDIMNPKF